MERRVLIDGMLLLPVMVALLVGSSEGLPVLADDSLLEVQGKKSTAVPHVLSSPTVLLQVLQTGLACFSAS